MIRKKEQSPGCEESRLDIRDDMTQAQTWTAIKARVRSSGAKGRSFRADITHGVIAGEMAWTRGEE